MTIAQLRVLSVPIVIALSACTTWTQPEPPGVALSRVSAKPIQVARTDHSTIVLKDASVQGDSLIGTANDGSNARVAIPISEITGVSERGVDGGRTVALGGAIILSTLGALFIAIIISLSQANWD